MTVSVPDALQPSLRRVYREAGRVTAPLRVLPSFLVVGGQRCGTTSLHRALRQHPAVVDASLKKGVHYFDLHYGKGGGWYRGHFPFAMTTRRLARRLGTSVLAGESTPYYMFHPLAPARIADDLPGVRLIAMLRDPVERAYSAYTHERARGYESLGFAEAVDAEPERLAGEVERLRNDPGYVSHAHQHNAYLTRGQYVEQLRALEAAVGRDRLLVLDSHRLFDDPGAVLLEVLDFLALPPDPGMSLSHHNERPRAALDTRLRSRLEAHFQPYDQALAAWWGRPVSWQAPRRG